MPIKQMAVLKKGKYIGKYKDGDIYYHSFIPEQIAVNGEIQFVRIGDYNQQFPTNRPYMLNDINKEEEKLITK